MMDQLVFTDVLNVVLLYLIPAVQGTAILYSKNMLVGFEAL